MIVLSLLLSVLIFSACNSRNDQPAAAGKYGAFSFSHQLTLPGTPTEIYDAATGDISVWWDHSFSETPYKMYIEPHPGGGFYEIFDESGDGVLHATVTAAHRGKLLRFVGPLGLAGHAVNMVCTYTFSAAGSDSTLLKLEVHVSGEIESEWPELVKKVWIHFLDERLRNYVCRTGTK